ncbi:MAG: hypothetical protein V3S18_04895 [Dehalococcoidia bacterium]
MAPLPPTTDVDSADAAVHFTALMEFADEASRHHSGASVDDHLAVVFIANTAE